MVLDHFRFFFAADLNPCFCLDRSIDRTISAIELNTDRRWLKPFTIFTKGLRAVGEAA